MNWMLYTLKDANTICIFRIFTVFLHDYPTLFS